MVQIDKSNGYNGIKPAQRPPSGITEHPIQTGTPSKAQIPGESLHRTTPAGGKATPQIELMPTITAATEPTAQAMPRFEKTVEKALKSAPHVIPPALKKTIELNLNQLRQELNTTPLNTAKAQQLLVDLTQKLHTGGLLEKSVQKDLNRLTAGLIKQAGKQVGLDLSVAYSGEKMLALTGQPPLGMTPDQQKTLQSLKQLCLQMESIKSSPTSSLTREKIFLMGLREELVRRSLETQIPPQHTLPPLLNPQDVDAIFNAIKASPDKQITDARTNSQYKDLGVISNAVKQIDTLLADTRSIPPDLLADLNQAVKDMTSAQSGQVLDAVEQFQSSTGASSLDAIKDVAQELQKAAKQNGPLDIPGLQAQMQKLSDQSLHSANGQSISKLTQDITQQLQKGSNTQGAQFKKQLAQLSDQLRQAANQGQQAQAPSELASLSQQMKDYLRDGPPDLAGGMADFITSYSKTMTGLQKSLPPLWFPITMPTPLTYGSGDTKIIIPAGSQISQNHSTGDYTLNSPGFLMQNGSTLVQTNNATIQLGKNVDRLNIASLNVSDGSTNTDLIGFTAQIDKANKSSLMRADSVTVNMTDGKVQLTNAQLIQNPNLFRLSSDSFLYQKGGDSASLGQFQLEQKILPNGTVLTQGSGNNLSSNMGGNVITADNLSFSMFQGEKGNVADSLMLSGTNVNVQTGDSLIKAASGTVNLISNRDGSSILTVNTQDASWQQGNQSIQTLGATNMTLQQDASGKIQSFEVSADDVKYLDPKNTLQVQGGALTVNYGENGLVKDLSAKATELNLTSPDGQLNAHDAALNLTYASNGSIQNISGQVGQLDYNGSQGNLQVLNGKLDATYGANGKLNSLKASSDKVNWVSQNGDTVNAQNAALNLNYHPNGNLAQASTTIGSLNASVGGQTIGVVNGAGAINYNPNGTLANVSAQAQEVNWQNPAGDVLKVNDFNGQMTYGHNGQLQKVTAQVGQADYTGSFGSLAATNTTLNLNYGANGNLKDASTTIGSLNAVTQNGDKVDITNGAAQLLYNENGNISQATASVGTLNWSNAAGDKLNVNGANMTLKYNDKGILQQANASAGNLSYVGSAGTLNTTGQTSVNALYDETGKLSSLAAHSDDINFTNQDIQVHAVDTNLNVNTWPDGKLKDISADTQNLEASGAWGKFVADGKTTLNLNYNADGLLSKVSGGAEHLNFQQGTSTLDLTGAKLEMNYDDKGQLQNAIASIQKGSYQSDFGLVTLTEGAGVQLNYGENGNLSNIQANVDKLNYTGDKGVLDLAGGKLNAIYGTDGNLQNLNFKGDSVNFNGTTGNSKALEIALKNFEVNLAQGTDGSQTLTFNGKDANLNIDGNKVNLENIENLELATNADGTINHMNLNLAGTSSFTDNKDNLTVALKNAKASYTQEGNQLTASFEQLIANIKDKGITAQVNGAILTHNDKQMTVHVDSAEALQSLGEQWNVKIENLDLVVDKTDKGGVKGIDLQVGKVDGTIKGWHAMVTTQNGDRVRLNVQMSEDGTMLKEAFLQIPKGGEIKLENKDTSVILGESQLFSFKQENGVYTLGAEGLNIDAKMKDTKVKVDGGDAQVRLDTNTGEIIIDKFNGSKITVDTGKQKIDIDVKKLEGFVVEAAGITGDMQGMMVRLKPTSDGSSMTLEARTEYNGIPLSVKFDNVHELMAYGTLQTNQAHVYMGDPSGRGEVKIEAGPLAMQGSAIEFVAQYHQYDSGRMNSALSRALSNDGFHISKGVSIEADGVVRMKTTNRGPNAELTLLFPRPLMGMQGNGQYGIDKLSNPYSVNSGIQDGAMGGILQLGWKQVGKKTGNEYTGGVHVGLVPGSYLSLDQTKGYTTVAGVPLSNHIAIPTTAIAGVNFRRDSKHSKFDTMTGVYVNPAAFANKDGLIQESTKYGAYTGFSYRTNDYSFGANITADMTNGKVEPGVGVQGGYRFHVPTFMGKGNDEQKKPDEKKKADAAKVKSAK